jgi:hypothetical protein
MIISWLLVFPEILFKIKDLILDPFSLINLPGTDLILVDCPVVIDV